jgi:hypothetical protein
LVRWSARGSSWLLPLLFVLLLAGALWRQEALISTAERMRVLTVPLPGDNQPMTISGTYQNQSGRIATIAVTQGVGPGVPSDETIAAAIARFNAAVTAYQATGGE